MSKIFLIPNSIDEENNPHNGFDASTINHLRIFFVEAPKAARAILRKLIPDFPLGDCEFHEINEHTKLSSIQSFGNIIKSNDTGIVSESGCPCIADPGADLVLLAHSLGVIVMPLVGPSSILLALMASGMNGQNFAFNGYLPKESHDKILKIRSLEQRAVKEGQTQIFMETPYRNTGLWETLLNTLDARINLCVAIDILGKEQFIQTKSVTNWRITNLQLPKKPALFIINKT